MYKGIRFHCDLCEYKGIVMENLKHHIDVHYKQTAQNWMPYLSAWYF